MPPGRTPRSFAAPPPFRRTALVPWWSLLLSTLALSVLGALSGVLELAPIVGAALFVCFAWCCLVLVVAELVHRVGNARSRR